MAKNDNAQERTSEKEKGQKVESASGTSTKGKKKVSARGGARKKSRKVQHGIAHVQATFNNILITITDPQGNALAFSSAGSKGFKGSRKSTPYAAQLVAEDVGTAAKTNFDMKTIAIYIKGPGPGRDSVIRVFAAILKITEIRDVTGIPHNGPRPPKKRRV